MSRYKSKTASIIFFLLLSTHLKAFQGGGSDAGNGGGLAEKNLIFAYDNLSTFLTLCLEPDHCTLKADERILLEKILNAFPQEQKTELQFISSKEKPDFFILEGQPKIAKTGNKIGDIIYINQEMLYPLNGKGEYQVIDVPMAAMILIHELGHHHGVIDHNKLDQLGNRVANFLYAHSLKAEFWNGNAALITYQLNRVHSDEDKKKLEYFDQVTLQINSELFNLSKDIKNKIHCPNLSTEPVGLRLYNLHELRGVKFDEKNKVLKKPVKAWYILSCKKGEESDHGDLDITLSFQKNKDESFKYLPLDFKVKQKSCSRYESACK
ncbi:MAG: hypothetical protein ACXVCP_18620 [Bdellovibrio sp.]